MNSKTILISAITLATLFTSCKKKEPTPENTNPVTPAPPVASWKGKTSPVTSKLNDVEFINASIGYAVGNVGTIIKTTNSGDAWTNVSVAGFTNNFIYLSVVDAQTVWATSFGSIYKTINGGTNWSSITTTLSVGSFSDIHFLNANTGFLATSSGIAITTDGGINWGIASGTTGSWSKLQFTSNLVGWAIGTTGILKTLDGGLTWTTQTNPVTTPKTMFFLNNNEGWVASSLGGNEQLWKTQVGGSNWSAMYTSTGLGDDLIALWFFDSSSGFRSRTLNKIQKTENVGTTWTDVSTPLTSGQNINDFYFSSSNLGWAVGDGGVILKYAE